MPRRSHHFFSRPIYESLPWFYITFGVAALIASYLLASRGGLSLLTGLLGLVILVGGIVVLLRRRDYRELRSQYANPDLLSGEEPP
jgi:Flp pilus assembly protein TadB